MYIFKLNNTKPGSDNNILIYMNKKMVYFQMTFYSQNMEMPLGRS